MARLIYSAIASLDGYVADDSGGFDWAAPDEQVHAFVNDHERGIGTYLYGRRMYDVMVGWETMTTDHTTPAAARDYATIWRAADKVVFSSTMQTVRSARTRVEPAFDADLVRRIKSRAAADLSVGGPTLAAAAFRHGLVDECHLFLTPVVVGGGTRALPDGVHLHLELLDERRFDSGVVHVHYRTVTAR